jgi:UDP-perosamine 4-acetyltransferase
VSPGLLIVGAGGHGRVVADAAADAGFDPIGFLDDAAAGTGRAGPVPVVGRLSALEEFVAAWGSAIVAIGDNFLRRDVFERARKAGFAMPAVIHPAATVSRHAELRGGVFVAAGAVVNVGAAVGEATIINTGATVDHDCRLGSAVHISPGAHLGGNVTIGDHAWIGIGASVRHGVRIGRSAVVGAGAAVVCDIPDAETWVGVPARPAGTKRSG